MMTGGAGMLVIPFFLLAFALSLMVPSVAWKVVGGMLMTLVLLGFLLWPSGRDRPAVRAVPMPLPVQVAPD